MIDDRTEDDAVRALRGAISERLATLPPPIDVYESVRHRRRRNDRRAILATVLAVSVIGTSAGAVTLRDGDSTAVVAGATPTATTGLDPLPEPCIAKNKVYPRTDYSKLPVQQGVRGSLGSDQALVRQVLETGWSWMVDSTRQRYVVTDVPPDPRTAKVQFVTPAGRGALALVTATTKAGDVGWAGFVARSGSQVRLASGYNQRLDSPPLPAAAKLNDFYGSEPALAWAVRLCAEEVLIALGPAGATATVTEARATPVRSRRVPMVDGFAAVRLPAQPEFSVTVERDGRTVGQRKLFLR